MIGGKQISGPSPGERRSKEPERSLKVFSQWWWWSDEFFLFLVVGVVPTGVRTHAPATTVCATSCVLWVGQWWFFEHSLTTTRWRWSEMCERSSVFHQCRINQFAQFLYDWQSCTVFECVARPALFAQSSECKSTILSSICTRFQPSEREFVLRSSQWWHGLEPRLSWRLPVRQGAHDGQENEGHRHWRWTRWEFLPAGVDLKGRVRTVFESVDLTLPAFWSVSWQSAKTLWWSWTPRQEECLSHIPSTCHICTALAFSLHTRRDIDSDDSHAHSSCVLHSPLSGSSVNESCAQDAEQMYGNFFIFWFFSYMKMRQWDWWCAACGRLYDWRKANRVLTGTSKLQARRHVGVQGARATWRRPWQHCCRADAVVELAGEGGHHRGLTLVLLPRCFANLRLLNSSGWCHVGAFQLKNIRGSRSFSDSGRDKQWWWRQAEACPDCFSRERDTAT